MPHLGKAIGEYRNVYLTRDGKDYRVAFHVGLKRPMIVCRVLKGNRITGPDEAPLRLDGPTAKRLIALALPVLEGAT